MVRMVSSRQVQGTETDSSSTSVVYRPRHARARSVCIPGRESRRRVSLAGRGIWMTPSSSNSPCEKERSRVGTTTQAATATKSTARTSGRRA